MSVTYSFQVRAKCPNDDSVDLYDVEIQSPFMIEVEGILDAVKEITEVPRYQEDITYDLFDRVGGKVTTWGVHKGVDTRCEVEL